MIVFDLKCGKGHVFEAWFADTATYESQVAADGFGCPVCGDTAIVKAPMAPNVAVPKRDKRTPASAPAQQSDAGPDADRAASAMAALRQMREIVEQNFDHVGNRFPEEARKIHYGEVERRSIYGDATKDEVSDLKDEGIEVGAIPWVPRHDA